MENHLVHSIPTKKLVENALIPQNAYQGDAGYDLYLKAFREKVNSYRTCH